MTMYPYRAAIAVNPYDKTQGQGVGQVYAPSDVNFETPLPTYDMNGLANSLEVDSEFGILPDFQVEDHPWVVFKSGGFTAPLTTSVPLPGPEGEQGPMGPSTPEAEAAALAAQAAADEAQAARVAAESKAGKSAYEIAVANGFVGTELQWLASLPGASGAQVIDNGTTVTLG